jgi:hypothetical protein
VVFAGTSAIKITNYQRYFNLLPGWAYRITEVPKEGEYRFLRFAWKSEGLSGIMLQLHDERDWHIRYLAGANKFGWAAQIVAATPPPEWTVVTVDLFKDFGERDIHGIALTAFDGVGHFDHIYLGSSLAQLDSIDATGLSGKAPLKVTPEELETHWENLNSIDASVAYRAFWTLAAGDDAVRKELVRKLGPLPHAADEAQLRRWLVELDHGQYAMREQASAQLMKHLAAAEKLIEDELQRPASLEARARLERLLLAARQPVTASQRSEQKARRLLKILADRHKE